MTTVSEQGHRLVGFRSPGLDPLQTEASPKPAQPVEEGKRWGLKLPSLRGRGAPASSLDRATRVERAEERRRQKEAEAIDAAKEAFFATPAGRARLAYKRGHQLFQYELPVGKMPPTVIPGPAGSPSRETTDPVDVLNSVTVEGWKLVTGKFIHSELRDGVIGCYLFKRSQKRRLQMNEPWRV